jgi:hypothetical protein
VKTVTFRHVCPVMLNDAPCEADVEVMYEPGRARDEFFSMSDTETCAAGHVIPDVVTAVWYEEDAVEYGQRLYEQYEAMKYYHESGGL